MVALTDERWATGEIVSINFNSDKLKEGVKKFYETNTKRWCSTTPEGIENIRKAALEWHSDPERNKNHREAMKLLGEKFKKLGTFAGENNPMYGSSRTGKDNPMYGKTHSEETRKKISEAAKGRKAAKGRTPWNKGKKLILTEEQLEKLKKPKEYLKGTKWYNNGLENKRFKEDQVPEGWILGRIKV